MENEKQQMLDEILALQVLAKENPCKLSNGLIGAMHEVLNSFIGKQCLETASRDQVASYLKRDVRTLTRWQSQYEDFPQPRHNGHRAVCYNWLEVVQWKLRHDELFQ